jgi:hypothetical protein
MASPMGATMKSNNRHFLVCAFMTVASALTSAGFSIAALNASGDAYVNAMYAASRSLSLAFVSIVVVFLRSRTGLMALSAVMVLVQSGDALIGAIDHDPLKTFGPAFLALLTAGALIAVMKADNKLGGGSNEFAP